MRFCTQCDNMYYIRISSENENQLIYYCRKCGHEDDSVTKDSIVVSKTSTASDKAAYLNNINEFTKLDPTLPRVTNVPCPNKECPSNRPRSEEYRILADGVGVAAAAAAAASGAGSDESDIDVSPGEVSREVIYMRYDDVNMKYVYICAHCDTVWRPDIIGGSE